MNTLTFRSDIVKCDAWYTLVSGGYQVDYDDGTHEFMPESMYDRLVEARIEIAVNQPLPI